MFLAKDGKLVYKEFYIPGPINAMQKVNVNIMLHIAIKNEYKDS